MTSASDGAGPGDLSSDEAFELIGNAQRIKILRALWESPDEAVSFSTLRTRVFSPRRSKPPPSEPDPAG